MIYIYGLRCPVEGVIRYVGKSVQPEKRIRAHLMAAQRGDYNHRTARWLRKIAKAGYEPELAILHQVAEGERWQDIERAFIASAPERGWRLTNSTAGGEGLDYIDPVADAAYRRKLSRSLKKVWGTAERRKQASEGSVKAWSDPEITARRLVSMKSAQSRPDVRARTLEVLADLASRPDVKAKKVAASTASWTGEKGAARREIMRAEETRQHMSEAAKARWADPEKGAAGRAANSTPERRLVLSEMAKRRATPEYRAMMAEKTRLSWAKRRAKGA